MYSQIIGAIFSSRYLVSRHAKEEAEKDDLMLSDICFSVESGEIIESYPEDRPYPSCLILGFCPKGNPIHSVWAYNDETYAAVIITVYRPDPNQWINWRKRRL
jgi:hypothetical protein